MNFYIVDDDPAIPAILHQIIENNPENTVVGKSTNAKKALTDVPMLDIDIVLVDLLMPDISGIHLINMLKKQKPKIKFIMISQVHDIDLRQQAYEAGIEFFIDKPINFVEVKTVTEKVAQNIQMQQKINNIKSLVESPQTKQQPQEQELKRKKVLSILRFLGITSETGSSDILAISQIMIENNIFFSDIEFLNNYNITNAEKKILFQRIRRGIKKGLTNLANIYLDEFENEIFIEYANSLYGYKNVRAEMRYLTGDRTTGGKVSLKKFFDGLLHECNGINF